VTEPLVTSSLLMESQVTESLVTESQVTERHRHFKTVFKIHAHEIKVHLITLVFINYTKMNTLYYKWTR
jgi:hypothetical protein